MDDLDTRLDTGVEIMEQEKHPIPRKKKLTEKQKEFVDAYLATGGNGSEAIRRVYGEVKQAGAMAYQMKSKIAVMNAIEEGAMECADIQMEMIRSSKTPAAVRNDAIKYRLSAVGVGKEEKDDDEDEKKYTINEVKIIIEK
jgi:phage terminase small subunit